MKEDLLKKFLSEADKRFNESVNEFEERDSDRRKKQEELTKANIALQERLVQCCIDFINETGNKDIWRVSFTADCLQESAKEGKWTSYTDSTCEVEGNDGITAFSA